MLPICDPERYPLLKEVPYPLLFVTISGSHLYGFPSEDSDVDLRGAHVAWTEELVGFSTPKDTFEKMEGDNDIVTHEIKKFCQLGLKHSGYCMEQLLSPLVVITSGWFQELRGILPKFLTKKYGDHYIHFTNNQLSILRRSPNKEVKVILYMFRVLMTGIYFARTGKIESNIVTLNETFKFSFVDDLVREKIEGKEKSPLAGTHSMDFYLREHVRLLAVLEDELSKSRLPQDADPSFVAELENFLIRVRRTYWKKSPAGGYIFLQKQGKHA